MRLHVDQMSTISLDRVSQSTSFGGEIASQTSDECQETLKQIMLFRLCNVFFILTDGEC